MNKRFFAVTVCAVIFNIILALVCFTVLYLVFGLVIAPRIPEEKAAAVFPVLFVLALALAFLIYTAALRIFLKRIMSFAGAKAQ